MKDKNILWLGVLCAAFTVISTFIVHLVSVSAETFEQRLLLPGNNIYIGRNIIVIVHCICVAVSMGVVSYARRNTRNHIFLKWGSMCFLIFSLAEITRMLAALVYANGLRASYGAMPEHDQVFTRYLLEVQWPLLAQVLFMLFVIAFAFGCLFTGIGLTGNVKRYDKVLSWLFLFWALQTFITIANETLHVGFDPVISFLSVTFQPAIRIALAYWLYVQLKEKTQLQGMNRAT